jgi:hypothetical protein
VSNIHVIRGGEGAFGGLASARVEANENTGSPTPVDLTTPGPAVTVVVPASGNLMVTISASMYNTTPSVATKMGIDLSGANTHGATDDSRWLGINTPAVGGVNQMGGSLVTVFTGLTPGSTTVAAKYWVEGGTGHFVGREVIVEPA